VLVIDEREIREGTSHACSFLYQPAARRVDLCAFSFASLGVQAIEASARFGGVVAGTRVYLLAARAPWLSGSGAPDGWSAARHGLAVFKFRARPKYRPSTLKGLRCCRGCRWGTDSASCGALQLAGTGRLLPAGTEDWRPPGRHVVRRRPG
jgi:hypothetical protein